MTGCRRAERKANLAPMIFSGIVTLLEQRDLGNGNYLAVFDAPQVGASTGPAQFVMLRVGEGADPLLGRPFSVARVGSGPHGATVEVIYKVVGRGTGLLAGLAPGAPVAMVGPLGHPFPDPVHGDAPVFMVAGGIGIAPFPFLAQHLLAAGSRPHLLYGARTADDLVARDLLPTEIPTDVATDDGSEGHAGFVTELLDRHLAELPDARRRQAMVYVCGPTPMMAATDKVIVGHGASGYLSLESFMGCGFGVCLSCVVPLVDRTDGYARICVDGPTFAAGQVDWARGIAG
jgi:dihydroorotate dehydrogenase electron transfer subunit